MVQFMPANHSNINSIITILIHPAKTHFQDIIVLLRHIAKHVTSSLISRYMYKHYYFNTAIFNLLANENVCYKRNEL